MFPQRNRGLFNLSFLIFSLPVLFLLFFPLGRLVTAPSPESLLLAIRDSEVQLALLRSLLTSLGASLISLILGTPLAYLLARRNFPGKRLVEGLIDLPIMIPHPVIGIAILGLAARDTVLGDLLSQLGVRLLGTYTGIVTVLTFVGLPFFLNTAKAGFEAVPQRLEHVSLSLGAGQWATFFRVTLPLAWRSMVLGMVMCMARALSEFGAVIVVAYHPMLAPVLIYERFTAFGLKYSQPVAVWLIILSVTLFVAMRFLSRPVRDW